MRKRLPILVGIICLCATGCGGPVMLKPQGRLMKKGEPFVLGEAEAVHVAFFPEEEQPEHDRYPARVNREDGTFKVLGVDGRGLPPGKYRATVQIMKKRKDTLKGAFDRTRSPFKIELTSATGEITLDLDEPSSAPAPQQKARVGRRDQQRR